MSNLKTMSDAEFLIQQGRVGEMSKMKEMQTLIEEVARIALENPDKREYFARELGLEEKDLEEVSEYLESLAREDDK